MAHPLSAFGAFHTALSIIPVVAGLVALKRHGKIDPATGAGKAYLIGMLASVLTAFGLSSTGGLNPGHALGLMALAVMAVAVLAPRITMLGRAAASIQVGLMSFSFMLLMVPGINETLSRLPAGHPIGNGPDSAPVQLALAGMLTLFLLGTAYQMAQLRRRALR
jgi:peptidoglycan/LPS O-acetylase OafA/YrhL